MTIDDGADDSDDGAAATTDDDTLIIGTSASETSVRVRAVARELTNADNDDGTTPLADAYGPPTLQITGSSTSAPTTNGAAMEEEIQLALAKPAGVGTQNIYRIDYSEDDGNTWMLLTSRTTFTGFDGNRRFQHTGLPFDETIHYRAFALRSNWRTTAGPVSRMVDGTTTASTIPGKVTGVMASSPDTMTIEASWSAPAEDGGQDIAKYQYQYVMDDGDGEADAGDWAQTGDDAPAPALTDNVYTDDAELMETIEELTLMRGELYYIRVRAVNEEAGTRTDAAGTTQGPWSDAAGFIAGAPTAPNMVEGITAEMAKDGTGTRTQRGVDVLWNAPSEGADVDHYVVERSMDDGVTWESPTDDAEESPASRTAYTDPRHYKDGETLVYRVAAENGAGKSPWVMVYYPRDPEADHTHPLEMLTAASNVLANGTTTSGEIEVTWTPGENALGHVIVVLDNGDNFAVETTAVPTADGMHTLTGLSAGTYTVVVVSFKSADDYEYDSSGGAGDSVDTAVVN